MQDDYYNSISRNKYNTFFIEKCKFYETSNSFEVIKFSVSGVMEASKGIKTNIIFTLDNGNDGKFENFLA